MTSIDPLLQLLAFFYIYAFLGWCVEIAFHAVTTGHLVNRGMLAGPVCPIYGAGMIAMVLCTEPLQQSWLLTFLGAMVICTIIELLVGLVLRALFHTQWWDYSKEPFNIAGLICLRFSIYWGFGGAFLIKVVHPPIRDAVALVPPLFLGDWLGWLYKALCLLVIACPCALVISTPVTIVSALATATRCGLLIKGGLFLEEARKLTNIGLDKTGTLTKGEPEVAGITLLGGADRKQVLSLAASLGAMNKHPLSAAIVREAKKEHAEIQPVADFTALPGEGVTGRIGTGRASLLNLAALDKRGLSSDEVADAFNRASENGMSSVALADTFGVLAVFVMADEIKADTRSGLAQLKAEGITPWLLTGDNERAAHALAGKLGLENVNADLLPEAKLARIRELQGQGLTAMVGDGINDAPALAQADIGIAMGVRGTDSAIEAADIAVMDDRISSVATLVRLSRMTHSVLVQNIAFALGIKIIFTILAISGFATMWMAVFADTGTCLIVVANGMRLMRVKPKLDRMAAEVDRAAGTAPQTHVQTAAA